MVKLLAMSPLEDESSMDADEHIEFLMYVLSVFEKTWDKVAAEIGDNVSTNKAIATKHDVPLIRDVRATDSFWP